MSDQIIQNISTMADYIKYLFVFFVSMVPLIEIRGSIPAAYSLYRLDNGDFNFTLCCVLSILGNMIPVPIIFFFARKVLLWGKDKKIIGKFFTFCLEKGEKGGMKLQEKAGRGLYFALFLFVGIPFPGTGAWTGTLAASILDMDFKKSVIAIIGGVLLAGIVVGLLTAGVLAIAL